MHPIDWLLILKEKNYKYNNFCIEIILNKLFKFWIIYQIHQFL